MSTVSEEVLAEPQRGRDLPERGRQLIDNERRTLRALTTSPVAIAVLVVGGLALWLAVFILWGSGLQEQHAQRGLYARFRSELAGETAPLGGTIRSGAPVAVLSIPSAGVHNVVVVEGTSSDQLRSGPGHLPDSPLPGQPGVSVLYGRALTFGGPFAHLSHLTAGKTLSVTTAEGISTFRVVDVRGAGDKIAAAPRSNQGWLTLVSARATGWRSGWAPSKVVYVDAELTSKVLPAGPSGPTVVATDDLPMHADSDGLHVLVLWAEALIAAGVITVLVIRRWGALRSWPLAVPLCAASLWGASACLLALLPNLM